MSNFILFIALLVGSNFALASELQQQFIDLRNSSELTYDLANDKLTGRTFKNSLFCYHLGEFVVQARFFSDAVENTDNFELQDLGFTLHNKLTSLNSFCGVDGGGQSNVKEGDKKALKKELNSVPDLINKIKELI